MSAALRPAPRTGFKFTISIRQGPDQGALYQLLPPVVTIGRSPENNIVLSDPKVSRSAARIEFTVAEITITDLSNRGALFINGEASAKASIKDGDTIQVGETVFSFSVEALMLASPESTPASLQPVGSFTATRSAGAGGGFRQMPQPRGASGGGNQMVLILIVLLLAGGGFWVYTSKPKIANPGLALHTKDAIESETKASEQTAADLVKKRTFKNDEEKTRFEEAQKQYLMGFRDYSKGQYMRAMREFETALAIDPDNQMARRYYKLSEKQRDERVADLSLEGRKYKDKHMYSRCESSFEKVLELIPDKSDAKFKEADALRNECHLLDEERFQ